MRLLHVITSLDFGGAQKLLSELIPIQVRQGIDVSVLVYQNVDNVFSRMIKDAGAQIFSLENSSFNSPDNIHRIRKFIKNYDIVHAHLFPSLYWVAMASKGLDLKLVYTEHSTSNGRRNKWYFRPIEKYIYRQYDIIISISPETQHNLQSWLKVTDSRFVQINNGIHIDRFKIGCGGQPNNQLIMVSRFVAAKDQQTVIKAMKYLDKDVSLVFAGEGDTLEECKQLAIEEGVSYRVRFLGNRSDIPELVASSSIGIQSSNWEGFGLTAIELMAAGKPVIASDVDGLKQVVEGAGLIFPKGDSKELARLVNKLLNDKVFYSAVANKCARRANLFDIHIMADSYYKVYQDVLS